MPEYRCTIEIDVDADSPREAAKQAETLLRDPMAYPLIVTVQQTVWVDGKLPPPVDIDLANIEESDGDKDHDAG